MVINNKITIDCVDQSVKLLSVSMNVIETQQIIITKIKGKGQRMIKTGEYIMKTFSIEKIDLPAIILLEISSKYTKTIRIYNYIPESGKGFRFAKSYKLAV